MKELIPALFFLFTPALNAQEFNLFERESIDGFYSFTKAYITKGNIKTVRVKTSAKDEGLPIKDTYARRYFEYDYNGNLLVFRRKKGFSSDTLRIENTYNTQGEKTLITSGDIYGRYTTRYFFGQNQLRRKVLERTSASGTITREYLLDYRQHADTLNETIANSPNGKVEYREVIRKSSAGLLEYYALLKDYSAENLRIYYEYNQTGRLIKKIVEERTASGVHNRTTITFQYDALGRLGSERKHKNGEFYRRVEYVYEGDLLKAKLEKNASNGKIVIHEFSYEFYLDRQE